MRSNSEKRAEVYSILSRYHTNVLKLAGLTTPSFEQLREDPDFEKRIHRFATKNLYVIDTLFTKEYASLDEELEYKFTYVQDMTNKYLRDILPPEKEDDSAYGNLDHPFWEKRWIFINNLIATY